MLGVVHSLNDVISSSDSCLLWLVFEQGGTKVLMIEETQPTSAAARDKAQGMLAWHPRC